jgi:multimeric flavodoxin WrbA
MKLIGLCCSPNLHGNTETLMDEALKGAQAEGAETELYRVAGKNIQPCEGCWSCRESGECKIQDDMQELYSKMLAADGIIFGSPIYFYGMTAQAKTIIDRTMAFSKPEKSLANKVGGVIVTAGSFGLVDAVKDFYFYMVTRQIIPTNYVAAYPERGSGVKKMEKCLKASFDMGRQMVKIAQKGPIYPVDIPRTSFAFGTHTK